MNNPSWILSYRFTGEVIEELTPILESIQKKLVDIWFSEIFCSLFLEKFFDEQNYSIEERYAYCLQAQNNKDFFIGFIRSENPSTWMKMELEKAIENKQKILLLIKEGIEEHHPEFVKSATYTIKFQTIDDLLHTLSRVELNAMLSI